MISLKVVPKKRKMGLICSVFQKLFLVLKIKENKRIGSFGFQIFFCFEKHKTEKTLSSNNNYSS